MKYLTIIIVLLIHINYFCQTEKIVLANKGNSIENLIPNNWKILDSSINDINNDGRDDLIFVVENTDNKNMKLNDGELGRDSINLNPRVLGIYFRKKNGKLIKETQADHFILLQDSPTMDEPFDGITILENGVIKIDFTFWYSAGSWSMSNYSYKFKFQNNKFELINYEANERNRGTGEETFYSINFITSKLKISKTIIDGNNDRSIKEEYKDFKLKKLKSLQSLGVPFNWELSGIYL